MEVEVQRRDSLEDLRVDSLFVRKLNSSGHLGYQMTEDVLIKV
jgi:hypothetical protein